MKRRRWPLKSMEIGATFVHPDPSLNVSKYVYTQGILIDRKFKTKRVPEGRLVRRVA